MNPFRDAAALALASRAIINLVVLMQTLPETAAHVDRVTERARSVFRAVAGDSAPPEPVPDAFVEAFSGES